MTEVEALRRETEFLLSARARLEALRSEALRLEGDWHRTTEALRKEVNGLLGHDTDRREL